VGGDGLEPPTFCSPARPGACGPYWSGLSRVSRLRRFHHWFTCITPIHLASRARTARQSPHAASLYVQNQYLGDPVWLARAHAYLRDEILANQNHPSVLAWSIGNELRTPATGSEGSYIAGAAGLVRQLDPTRPVAMAISNWPGVPCQGAYAPLDAIGFNDYSGWFDAGGARQTNAMR